MTHSVTTTPAGEQPCGGPLVPVRYYGISPAYKHRPLAGVGRAAVGRADDRRRRPLKDHAVIPRPPPTRRSANFRAACTAGRNFPLAYLCSDALAGDVAARQRVWSIWPAAATPACAARWDAGTCPNPAHPLRFVQG